jgi:protein TonB
MRIQVFGFRNAMHAADTLQHPPLTAPPRLLAGCLLASIALHGLLLALPGWRQQLPVDEAPRVMDVVLMPAAEPAPTLPAVPRPLAEPSAQSRVLPRQPQRLITAAPSQPAIRADIAEPSPVVVAAVPAASDAPRDAAGAPANTVAKPATEPVLTPPSFSAAYLRNPPPRYPLSARRSGEEGTVLLRVRVTADGAAVQVELDRSSGHPLLDGAAQEAVRGWKFVPALRGNRNVEDWVRVPVVFRLES